LRNIDSLFYVLEVRKAQLRKINIMAVPKKKIGLLLFI